jgi:hypothetical protein
MWSQTEHLKQYAWNHIHYDTNLVGGGGVYSKMKSSSALQVNLLATAKQFHLTGIEKNKHKILTISKTFN